jgi:aminopeptidase
VGYSRAVDDRTLEGMADLVVEFGANVQPGQRVHVGAAVGQEGLARAIAARCYRAGAVFVHVAYSDPWLQKARLDDAVDEALGYEPGWLLQMIREHGEERGASIGLSGPVAPGLLDGADPDRIRRDVPPGRKESLANMTAARLNWSAIPCPTPGWAALVHPDLDPDAALAKLWEEVVHICRLDEADPVAAWGERMEQIERAKAALNELRLDAVHLRGPGTNLEIGLLPSSKWMGGHLTTCYGLDHHPNLPTEEVFAVPDPERVQGTVRSSKPLQLSGSIVRDFTVHFDRGRVSRIDAAANGGVLKAYADRDEGASRLGEIALVDGRGRVGPLQTVFYDTLIDENAASHMALGQGFDWAVDEADVGRINRSQIHIDFMVGSDEMEVDGVTAGGEQVPLLRGGAWQV